MENFDAGHEELSEILRTVGSCCAADPSERDMFGDLDGFDHLKRNIMKHKESMPAFCEMVPPLVSKHVINQCYIRDDDETKTVQFRKTG